MWYYAQDGRQIGPVENDAFSNLARSGSLGPDTLVWREGMKDWVPLGSLQSGAAQAQPPAPAQPAGALQCVQCGHLVSPDHAIEFEGQVVCSVCKPLFFQRLREGGGVPNSLVYASILRRFAALFLDSILFNAFAFAIFFVVGFAGVLAVGDTPPSETLEALLGLFIIATVFGGYAFYMTWFVGRFGATPGKMMLGIKIVRGDGAPVSYTRAFGRMFAHQLSGMILYIGFIIAFFDDERRALHDMLCDTRVIEKN